MALMDFSTPSSEGKTDFRVGDEKSAEQQGKADQWQSLGDAASEVLRRLRERMDERNRASKKMGGVP